MTGDAQPLAESFGAGFEQRLHSTFAPAEVVDVGDAVQLVEVYVGDPEPRQGAVEMTAYVIARGLAALLTDEQAVAHRRYVRAHRRLRRAVARRDVQMVDAAVERGSQDLAGLILLDEVEDHATEDRHGAVVTGPAKPSRLHGATLSRERRQASVHGEDLTGDVGAARPEEEHDGVRDLPGCALATERDTRRATAGAPGGRHPPQWCVDEAGGDRVDPDAAPRAFDRGMAGEPELRRLGCVVRRQPAARLQTHPRQIGRAHV